MVHGCESAARNVAPCALLERLVRVHDCSGRATKTAWTAAVMSMPDMTPPLAATASALVMTTRSASALASALAAAAVASAATMPSCAESACQPLMATAPVFTHMLPGLMRPPSTRAWTRATAVGARAMFVF